MTQADLDGWLKRLSYRPTWELRAELVPGLCTRVLITVGSYGPCTIQPNTECLPARYYHHNKEFLAGRMTSIESFADAVLEVIQELETHEMLEYFRVDGVHWHTPHIDGDAVYQFKPRP